MAPTSSPVFLLLFLHSISHTAALDNGLGLTPQMGWNSWYDVMDELNETLVMQTADALVATGLHSLGYKYINLDDFWAGNRTANGTITADPSRFPSGSLKPLADYVHSLGLLFGVYTDRGTETCGGRPGSHGYEELDAQTYAEWGVDYVKEDSCNAPNNPIAGYEGYSKMRDALNSTGRPIFFSLCGWEYWYSPIGKYLGNSFRIGPDDTDWEGVKDNININSQLYQNAGPGGWNDPCLLLAETITGELRMTQTQTRTQFNFWAIMASPMLISANIRNMSAFNLETYSNAEVIAVGQDPLGKQGVRIFGSDLPISEQTNAQLKVCEEEASFAQEWQYDVVGPQFLSNPISAFCLNVAGCGTQLSFYPCQANVSDACCGFGCLLNQQFEFHENGTLTTPLAPGKCLQSIGPSSIVLASCSPLAVPASQTWIYNQTTRQVRNGGTTSNMCLTTTIINNGTGLNIWARELSTPQTYAVLFANAGGADASLTCDRACFQAMGYSPGEKLVARDLWAKTNVTIIADHFTVPNLAADGGSSMFIFSPYTPSSS